MYAIIEQSERMIKADINKLILNILNDEYVKAFVIDANRDRLRNEGKDIFGDKITTYTADYEASGYPYAMFTVMKRRSEGKQVDHVDLFDSGTFYNSIEANLKNNEYIVVGDFKSGKERMSKNIVISTVLGFDDKTIEGIIEFIQAMIATEQLKAFGIE